MVPIEFLSDRGGWVQAEVLEKMESIGFLGLGTTTSLYEIGLQNLNGFVGLFFLNLLRDPTGRFCLKIHGYQICVEQLVYPTGRNLWVPLF